MPPLWTDDPAPEAAGLALAALRPPLHLAEAAAMIARLGAATPERVSEMAHVLAATLMSQDRVDREAIHVYAVAADAQGLLLAWQALAPRSPVWARLRVLPDGILVVALADVDTEGEDL
jgi:hypothetical protein